MLAGRSETEVEYDVGFNSKGRISALSVRPWWLAGGDLDLAWNDMMIIQTGADQVIVDLFLLHVPHLPAEILSDDS